MNNLNFGSGESDGLSADDLAKLDKLGLPSIRVKDPIHIGAIDTTSEKAVRTFSRADKALQALKDLEEKVD